MILLRAVPPELVKGVASGIYKVTGSVVRDVASGRGVAFLQETGLMQTALNAVLSSGGNPIVGLANLGLGAASVIQNQQIKTRLAEVQSSLALLQNLQIGTLALSGVGLGVSVAGFAVMLHRLKGIQAHLDTIEDKIEKVTSDRQRDDVRMIFADVMTQLETVETLALRSNKVSVAEASEQGLAKSAGRLEVHFQEKSKNMQLRGMVLEDLDYLWSLASAIRICHEAGLRALFSIDELAAAQQSAGRRAQKFLDLSQTLSPDALARLFAHNATASIAYVEQRRVALPQAETLVRGLRDSVASISSQSELAQTLTAKQISGSDYLKDIADEKDSPLLILPTD